MLHALREFATQHQLIVMPGLKPKFVRWLLVFSPTGQFLNAEDLTGGDKKSKGREFPACPDLTQPEMVGVGGGCRHFLVDSLDVVCLLAKDGQVDDDLTAKHEFFVSLLDEAKESLPPLGPISESLRSERSLEAIRAKLGEGKAKPMDSATVAMMDETGLSILVAGDVWHDWWQRKRGQMANARKSKRSAGRKATAATKPALRMRCLLSGEFTEPLATHNKIEGLSDVGGRGPGDSLVSFDKDAFTSYGLEQGANAAMSESMVKTYVTALNHLIRNQSRRLAGVKVVYWYSGRLEPKDDPLPDLFDGLGPPVEEAAEEASRSTATTAEVAQAASAAARLLDAVRSGKRADLVDYRYYALTLSANSGRVVIRDWMEGRFTELLESVNAWFADLAIIHRDGRHIVQSHKFGAVLAAPLRELGDVSAPLVATLWRCALKRQPIPHNAMAQTLHRVRLDVIRGETPLHARLGLLKAYCNRSQRMSKMKPELNDLENDPAYLYGRIMAILANIQYAALGDVGAGVVQRYYAAASATPGLVLGRLVRLAQTGHLPKIEPKGRRIGLEKQLADAWSRIGERPHATLSLQEQTLFAMGYYQQVAQRYASTREPSEHPAESATN